MRPWSNLREERRKGDRDSVFIVLYCQPHRDYLFHPVGNEEKRNSASAILLTRRSVVLGRSERDTEREKGEVEITTTGQ